MSYDNGAILDWQTNARYPHADAMAALGWIPSFVTADDPRPAFEQFNERYIHGGWNPQLPGKWKMDQNDNLFFPGDPPLEPLAFAWLRDEKIIVYPHAWVAIVQPAGSFSIARMD